ncbi:ATP synthase, subunit E [Lycorma delicatula]|uniref:ATP synthase, subunit E n=1 Tax=Lycorma delicatula TaxID=130591 RepID=UPI003F50DD05
MVQQYAPPVNVSPFIKFSRWSLLLLGIAYGSFWNSRYAKYEQKMAPIWAKEKEERHQHLEEEKKRRTEIELKELEKLAK